MDTERELLLGLVDHLGAELEVPSSYAPWSEVQTWYMLLLPACTDAGLLWEHTGSDEDVGGFWVFDPTVGTFNEMQGLPDVMETWMPALRAQIERASQQQVRRYGAWAYAIMQR